MSFREKTDSLAELYPDARIRSEIHYRFAHRFLRDYAHANPFNFVLHGCVDPTRFIQARWQIMEEMRVLQRQFGPPDQPMISRCVTDLVAWAQDAGGKPAVFVQMPVPEAAGRAFFIAVVLSAPLVAFNAAGAAMRTFFHNSGPLPAEALLGPVQVAPGRYFTLERSVNLEGQQALDFGHFCEWTRTGEHRSSGAYPPTTREAFAEAVTCALALGPALPAMASSNPQQNVIRIPLPPLSSQPPV